MNLKPMFAILGLGSAFLFAGCGGGSSDSPDLGEVTGNVTLDGKPVEGLTVAFQPEDGRPSTGKTDASGNYTLQYTATEPGAKVGKHVVSITSPAPDSGDCCGGSEDFVDPIPPKYNLDSGKTPEMQVEVKPGPNEFNFKIESDPSASAQRRTQSPRRAASCCDE